MVYPTQAKEKGIEGRVFIQFIVDENGQLDNVKAVKGIGAGCDEEAIRVIENSAKWHPGKQRGKAVKVRMILPITFKLDMPDENTLSFNSQRIEKPKFPPMEELVIVRRNRI